MLGQQVEAKFSWHLASDSFTASPWPALNDPTPETEIRREIRALQRHKQPLSNGFSTPLFKDRGIELVREFQVLLSEVRYSEKVPS